MLDISNVRAVDEVDARCPAPDSRWRHRKGKVYRVLQGCVIEATCTAAVSYRLDEPGTYHEMKAVWVRPLAEFLDGRFTLVSDGD